MVTRKQLRIAFHLERPCFRFDAVRLTGRFGSTVPRALRVYPGAHDSTAVNSFAERPGSAIGAVVDERAA
jgi:hypothetical protein